MEAVNALYSTDDADLAESIVASLRRRIFDGSAPSPAKQAKRRMSKLIYGILRRTTRKETRKADDGHEYIAYRNPILEGSKHPYALTLLTPTGADSANFVEGGDPMNAPYMMLCPEIRQTARLWDRLLLESVQGTDVQLRFVLETRFTYEAARERLEAGRPVRIKAAAAGTGLSLILVYDRLIRDGYDPELIHATITDRDQSNVVKTGRLLAKLATTSAHRTDSTQRPGICDQVKDLMHLHSSRESANEAGELPYDIVTLVGILEYFPGHTCSTTNDHHGEPPAEHDLQATDLLQKIDVVTTDDGTLITNSYRVEIGARLIELWGKRLFFRNRSDLESLVETAGFTSAGKFDHGHIYDVEAFRKREAASSSPE